jgi:hypothetical protein
LHTYWIVETETIRRGSSDMEQAVSDISIGACRMSQGEFLRTLRRLGAKPKVRYCQFDAESRRIQEIQHVYLRCRLDQWARVFGEPEAVSPGYDSTNGTAVRTWRQRCVEGPVMCIGHLYEHPSGVRWVIVTRVCFA